VENSLSQLPNREAPGRRSFASARQHWPCDVVFAFRRVLVQPRLSVSNRVLQARRMALRATVQIGQCAADSTDTPFRRGLNLPRGFRRPNPVQGVWSNSKRVISVSIKASTFVNANPTGPWACHFCSRDIVPTGGWRDLLVIHHINGDHSDNTVSNLSAAHYGCCHSSYHGRQAAAKRLYMRVNPLPSGVPAPSSD